MINDKKIGLALSGGGYRAAAYHIGTLRALHQMDVLDKVDVISSISGGSITAAYYALHKDKYEEFEKSLIEKLRTGVLWATLLILVVEGGILLVLHGWLLSVLIKANFCLWGKVASSMLLSCGVLVLILFLLHKVVPTSILIEQMYRSKFFGNKTLSDLPEKPIFAINATDVEQNQHFTFSQLKAVGGRKYPKTYFLHKQIPISLAVMASSAYPMFSPVRIPKKYLIDKNSLSPILVDGGIYDNHGSHKLSERGSAYYTDFIIVSEAGNTLMSRKGTWNITSLLFKVINMMMNRIEKLQRCYNEYRMDNANQRYAYVALTWRADKNYVERFVENIKRGYVSLDLCKCHGIDEPLFLQIRNGEGTALEHAKQLVEKSIGWDVLYANRPEDSVWNTAIGVSTGLFGLSKKQIDSLIAVAEWMTRVQVLTYLKNIL